MYPVEQKPASKNSWFTPQESRNYYGRYSRDSIAIHWWGGGEGADRHDSIVNYFLSQGQQGNKSVNYVVSDNKITEMVNADNVAWCTQNANPYSISIEHQPTLGPEGYKKSGWLVWQLRQRYGKYLNLFGHNSVYPTQCPGSISLDRIEQEANRWASGAYNPQPEWLRNRVDIPDSKRYTLEGAKLINLNNGSTIKTFSLDQEIDVGGTTSVNGIGYFLSVYSMNNNQPNGIAGGELKDKPTPPPEPTPEWIANLHVTDPVHYWFAKNSQLYDIATGKPAVPGKLFAKDEEFVAKAKTMARGVSYVITQYSFEKKIYNGVPIDDLTLTRPGLPDVPPVPIEPPADSEPDRNAVVAFLINLGKIIAEFLAKFKIK